MGFLDKLFGAPKPDKFAQIVIAGLKAAGDKRDAAYDPPELQAHIF